MRFLFVIFSLIVSGCHSQAENPYSYHEDDKMIGSVLRVENDKVIVDISKWEKRDAGSEAFNDIGYEYTAFVTEDTVIRREDGTEVALDDINNMQKVQVNPPRDDDFEGEANEIILLDMTYEEKYKRLLSHTDKPNVMVLFEKGERPPVDLTTIMENADQPIVAGSMEYPENHVVDFKEELDIEKLPVYLVFDQEKFLYKTYDVEELYKYFDTDEEDTQK